MFLTYATAGFSQRKIDSLGHLLQSAAHDTTRVQLLWQMAKEASFSKPDTALVLSFEALTLSRKIKYTEGESRALGIMANAFMRIGNYTRALELNIEKLKLEEQRHNPRSLASVLMNIGIVYALQEEYQTALGYYHSADSLIRKNGIQDLQYNIALNTGDTYDRLNLPDSAFPYFSRSLALARAAGDVDLIGTSLTGMGHTYLKKRNPAEARSSYSMAMACLRNASDEEMLCEATLGMAKAFAAAHEPDSALYYARYSLAVSGTYFPARELEAAEFLQRLHRQSGNFDSGFVYVDKAQALNDAINSKSNVRRLQVISSNESLRQLQLSEELRAAKAEREEQLQLLLIAVFIPAFFLITLFLSRIALSVRFIRLMGVLSLLFFFEFVTLLIHPHIASLTHHTPVYELILLVGLAAFIIPLHHRAEHWVIERLIKARDRHLVNLKNKIPAIKKPPVRTGGKKLHK